MRLIVLAWQYEPNMTRVLQAYPRLTQAAVEEALAFYQVNHAEIERYITDNDAERT